MTIGQYLAYCRSFDVLSGGCFTNHVIWTAWPLKHKTTAGDRLYGKDLLCHEDLKVWVKESGVVPPRVALEGPKDLLSFVTEKVSAKIINIIQTQLMIPSVVRKGPKRSWFISVMSALTGNV